MDIFEYAKARILAGKDGSGGSGGGGGGSSKDETETVNFHDYDGTLLHSFSLEEIQAMTELPPLPTQPGLICQGWNWSLDDIKDHNRALDIGATYITDDGKTRLYISVDGLLTVTLSFGQSKTEGVIIDWGDNSPTMTTTNSYLLKHTYASEGDYVITLDPVEGCEITLGDYNKNVIGTHQGSAPSDANYAHANMLVKVEIGRNAILGRSAFYYCEALETATIPNGITRLVGGEFMQSKRLKGLVIPNGVKSIDGRTLYYCYALSFVSIPNGMKSMVSDAFGNNYALKSVTMPNSMTSARSFGNNFTSLKRISLPDVITTTPFLAATAISSIKLPSSLTSIDSSSFKDCKALSSIEIPEAVTSIGANAFQNCKALGKVKIPSNVTSIGNYAFDGCSGITSVELPNGLKTIGQYAFQYCYALTSVKIPNTVTSIGAYAFQGCSGVSSVKIPSSVTSIGNYAFYKCSTLIRVELQEGLKSIGNYAFSGCAAMTGIKIPGSVTSIGTSAFASWHNAKYFDLTSHTSVPALSNASAFPAVDGVEIRVPAALYEEWIAATNWSARADYIVAV